MVLPCDFTAVCHYSKTKKSTGQSFFNFQENLNYTCSMLDCFSGGAWVVNYYQEIKPMLWLLFFLGGKLKWGWLSKHELQPLMKFTKISCFTVFTITNWQENKTFSHFFLLSNGSTRIELIKAEILSFFKNYGTEWWPTVKFIKK
jgi:hypothetical protein